MSDIRHRDANGANNEAGGHCSSRSKRQTTESEGIVQVLPVGTAFRQHEASQGESFSSMPTAVNIDISADNASIFGMVHS